MNDERKLAAYEIYWGLRNTHLAAKWQSIWWDVERYSPKGETPHLVVVARRLLRAMLIGA